MYDRTNAVLVRNPNLYVGLMGAIAVTPWIALVSIKPSLLLDWRLLSFAAVPVGIFILNLIEPFSQTDHEAFERRIERNYRLIRVIVLPAMIAVFGIVSLVFPTLDIDRLFGALMASCAACMFLGQHVRLRWLKPESDSAEMRA